MDKQLAIFLNNGKDNGGDIIIVSSDDAEILCHSIVVQLTCQSLFDHIENRYKNKNKDNNEELVDNAQSNTNNDNKDDKHSKNNSKQNNDMNKRRKISKNIYKRKIHLDYTSKVITVFLNKMYDSKYKINTLDCYEILELIKLLDEFMVVNKNETISEIEMLFSEKIDATNWLSLLYEVLNDKSYAFLLKIIRVYFISTIESSNSEQVDKLMSSFNNMDSKLPEIYTTCIDWFKIAVKNLREKSNNLLSQANDKKIIEDTIKNITTTDNTEELVKLNNKLKILRGNRSLTHENLMRLMDSTIKMVDDKLKPLTSQNNNQTNKQENTVGMKVYTPVPIQMMQKQSQPPCQNPQRAIMTTIPYKISNPPTQQRVVPNKPGPHKLLIPPTQTSNSQQNQTSQVITAFSKNTKNVTESNNSTSSTSLTPVDLTSKQM